MITEIHVTGDELNALNKKVGSIYMPKPMTNEEWRKACSTEEFTEELTKVVLDIVSWNNDPKPSEVRNILKAWLKRPHAEKGSNTQ